MSLHLLREGLVAVPSEELTQHSRLNISPKHCYVIISITSGLFMEKADRMHQFMHYDALLYAPRTERYCLFTT